MCLDTRFKPEVEKKMIAELPDGLITVYRVVDKIRGRYESPYFGRKFRVGLNHAKTKIRIALRYPPGTKDTYSPRFHSFAKMCELRRWGRLSLRCRTYVKFQIRKEWITAIGKQNSYLVYVTDRIISPSLRDKSAVVE